MAYSHCVGVEEMGLAQLETMDPSPGPCLYQYEHFYVIILSIWSLYRFRSRSHAV